MKVMFSVWILAKLESLFAARDRFDLLKSTSHYIFKKIVITGYQII